MSGSHFIAQTSTFGLMDATAVTLGQGHGKVIQYNSPDPYTVCAKYQRFSSNGFDVRGKSFCGGGRGRGRGGRGRGGNELKTERGDLIKLDDYSLQTEKLVKYSKEYVKIYPACNTFQFTSKLLQLRWRHNECDDISNHRRLDCLLNRLFRRRSKKTLKTRHWPLWGEFTGDQWIPRTKGQWRANVSIWWRHRAKKYSSSVASSVWGNLLRLCRWRKHFP